ncbi:MFS transporter, NNP family, nitrate/nitrite transporter [Desulfurella multipotens]|uniref:MFS transporter, NNP family, nitrate/nitrite transporter n=1 Tax=Desulfurella multipotens TaxID=79269 RepID=A0A1G6R6U5_9BACT|nr:MFS transporter [Desulfurella multipotens]SDD00238.1 MFS transporter, NNP family, nitrate/nitrite transporter [Desulfurella multipotens]
MNDIKGTPTQGLFGATLGFFFGFAAVALFGPTAAKFKDILNLTPQMVGLLVAMPALSGSLLRIPFSAWVDTTGGRKPFLILMLIAIIGLLGLSIVIYMVMFNNLRSGVYELLLLFGLLSGSGIATFSVGISQVSYWYPQQKQGFALGTYAGVGNLAPGIFSFLLPIALHKLGLFNSYLIWLGFLVIGTILYYATGKNAPYFQLKQKGLDEKKAIEQAKSLGQELFPSKSLVESLTLSAKNFNTWLLVILYFTTFGGFVALTAWLPTYWKSYFNLSLVYAGLLTALYSILTSANRIAGGVIADKIGGANTAIISLALMGIGALGLFLANSIGIAILSEIVLAIGMGVNNAAVFKLVPKLVSDAVGGAAGWVGGLGAFGGFVIPPIMGEFVAVYKSAGYAKGFIVFVVLAVVSIAIAYYLKLKAKA